MIPKSLCILDANTHTRDFSYPAHMLPPYTNNLPPRTQKLAPTVTSIISLVRLDERKVRWPTQANGWTATQSSRGLAQRCPRVGQRLVRQTAGLPLSPLTHRWESYDQPQPAGLRYNSEQITHTHPQIPECLILTLLEGLSFVICWYHKTSFGSMLVRLADCFSQFTLFTI